jgi:hypothetical protein
MKRQVKAWRKRLEMLGESGYDIVDAESVLDVIMNDYEHSPENAYHDIVTIRSLLDARTFSIMTDGQPLESIRVDMETAPDPV